MIFVIYLVLGFFCMRDAWRPMWMGKDSLFPVLRLLVIIEGFLILAQIWTMDQVYRHEVFEVMAYSPLLLLWVSVRQGESLKLLTVLWPFSFGLLCMSFFSPDVALLSEPAAEHSRSVFLHICLALGGYASFLIVTLCAAIYLWQRYLLKKHTGAPVLRAMPSLIDLNAMQWRALCAGIILLTLAIGLGKLSPYLWDIPHHWGVKETLSVLIWSHYVVLAILKKRWMLNKEHFAYGALVGLLLVLSTFSYLGLGSSPEEYGATAHSAGGNMEISP
jgi:ABC-type uncharacterized transport system permease subunit